VAVICVFGPRHIQLSPTFNGLLACTVSSERVQGAGCCLQTLAARANLHSPGHSMGKVALACQGLWQR